MRLLISVVLVCFIAGPNSVQSADNSRPILGTEKCTWGPSYWCSSKENAKSCGTEAVAHCTKVNWQVPQDGLNGEIDGANNCTWGPSYWCANKENAKGCGEGAVAHCNKVDWKVPGDATPRPGGNSCTWGPSYWCAKPENAKACGEEAVAHCKKIKDASGLSNHVAPEFLMIYSLAAGLLLLITNL